MKLHAACNTIFPEDAFQAVGFSLARRTGSLIGASDGAESGYRGSRCKDVEEEQRFAEESERRVEQEDDGACARHSACQWRLLKQAANKPLLL